MYIQMFTVALFTVEKIKYIYTSEYHLAIKRNGVLIYATTGMSIANMLSKTNQSQKAMYSV